MKTGSKMLCMAMSILLALSIAVAVSAEETDNRGTNPESQAEEQGVEEIQTLVELSNVTETDGMGLEELTETFAENAMSEYCDSQTGFTMQYPSFFAFGEEEDIPTATSEDGKAGMTIESMKNEGQLTEEVLLEAIRFETPDAEPQKNEQNGCIRVSRLTEGGTRCQTDLYFITEKSFHHITIQYPAEEQEKYDPYIEYMINTMGTEASEQG